MRCTFLHFLLLFFPLYCLGQFPFLQTQKGIASIAYSYALSDGVQDSFSLYKTEYFNKNGTLRQLRYADGSGVDFEYIGNRVYARSTWSPECPIQYDVEIRGDTQRVWVAEAYTTQSCNHAGAAMIYSTTVCDSLFVDVPKHLPIQKNAYFFSEKINGTKAGTWSLYEYFTYPGSHGLELRSIEVQTALSAGIFMKKRYERSRIPERHIYLESTLFFDSYGSFLGSSLAELPQKEQFAHTFDAKGQVIAFRAYKKVRGKQGYWKRRIRYYAN